MDCCVIQRELDHMLTTLRWNGEGFLNLREGDPTLAFFSGSYMDYAADRLNKGILSHLTSACIATTILSQHPFNIPSTSLQPVY